MSLRRMTAEENAAVAHTSAFDDMVAHERGRLFATRNMIEDPEVRKRVEDAFGLEYCKLRFPEVYATGRDARNEWKPVIDLIPGLGSPIS